LIARVEGWTGVHRRRNRYFCRVFARILRGSEAWDKKNGEDEE